MRWEPRLPASYRVATPRSRSATQRTTHALSTSRRATLRRSMDGYYISYVDVDKVMQTDIEIDYRYRHMQIQLATRRRCPNTTAIGTGPIAHLRAALPALQVAPQLLERLAREQRHHLWQGAAMPARWASMAIVPCNDQCAGKVNSEGTMQVPRVPVL